MTRDPLAITCCPVVNGWAARTAQKNAPAAGRGGFSVRLSPARRAYLPFFAAGFAVDFVVFFETFFLVAM